MNRQQHLEFGFEHADDGVRSIFFRRRAGALMSMLTYREASCGNEVSTVTWSFAHREMLLDLDGGGNFQMWLNYGLTSSSRIIPAFGLITDQ